MSPPWQQLPEEIPANNQVVWVRIRYYYGRPFLAVWKNAQKRFDSVVNDIQYPAWSVARWRVQ